MTEGRNEEFEYSYSAPTDEERREIEGIREKYIPQMTASQGIQKLKRMDAKVNRIGFIVSITVGLFGFVTFIVGMVLCLQFEANTGYLWGLFGVFFGIAILFLSFPIRQWLNRWSRRKYGPEILKLADEILSSEKTDGNKARH